MSTNTPILRPAPDGTLPLPTFLGVLSQYGTFRSLARCLDTRDMFNLRLLSKELVDNYKAYIHVRWDPNRRQKRFVNKPEDFRSMMGRYDAIISGSFVFQFLDDVTWLESGIDIFMPKGNATDFGDYFVEKEGYKFSLRCQAGPHGDNPSHSHAKGTDPVPSKWILHYGWNEYHDLEQRLLGLSGAHFSGTTTQYRLKSLEKCSTKHMTKYATRGWKTMGIMLKPEPSSGSIRTNTVRRVGDSKSWKLSLDVTGVDSSSTPDCAIEHSYFYLNNIATLYYICEATEYRNDVLKYRYTRSAFIGHRLRIVTVAELLRLNPQDIPENVVLPTLSEMMSPKYPMYTFMEIIPMPESWNYIDSQIPNWSKEWEAEALADDKKTAQVKAAGGSQPDVGANGAGGVSARGGDSGRNL
ncbi:hypothetical protein IFR04_015322 [Cadophora malorum]|uniref:Uncharacterized protein n=1 Tax=Cadophora malorum TaxID=108018 RepID=A0A8H7SXW1_9HELO|nr:hypothetical protein IFR04_015322 [Cadophora malorum]